MPGRAQLPRQTSTDNGTLVCKQIYIPKAATGISPARVHAAGVWSLPTCLSHEVWCMVQCLREGFSTFVQIASQLFSSAGGLPFFRAGLGFAFRGVQAACLAGRPMEGALFMCVSMPSQTKYSTYISKASNCLARLEMCVFACA